MNRQKAWKRAAAAMLAVTTLAGNLLAPAQLKLGTLSETAITAEASTITKKNFTFDSSSGTLTITGTINDEHDPEKMISELLTIYNQNTTYDGLFSSKISKEDVKHIVFASTAKLPRSCRQMFEGYTSLEDVVFEEGCDISNVFKLSAMFKDCTSLTKFDMNGATGANGIKYTADMFEGCTALKEVYMTSVTGEVICNGTWDEHTALDHIRQMVESCSSLKTLELSNSFVYYAIENVKKNDGDTSLDEILDTILENCDSPYVDDIRAALEAQYWAYVHALEDGQQFKAIDWQWSEYSEAEGFTCQVTIQKLYPEVETHVVSADVTVYTTPATCLNDGSELYSASWTNAGGTDFYCTKTRTHDLPALGHTEAEAVEENRVEPTCTEAGHYDLVTYCSVCGAELNRETVEIPATGHTAGEAVEENRVEPTCAEAGHYDSVIYCSVCGTELNRVTVEIPATDEHTAGEAVEENRVEPTCTEAGHYDSVVYCSDCGKELSRATIEIPAAGHTEAEPVEENRVEATCTEAGHYDSVVYCSVCGAELNRETVEIPATGHTEAEPVEENRVEATCTEAGHYDLVTYCAVCGAELNRETVEIPATGHTEAEPVEENRVEPTCTEAGHYDLVTYCSVCGAELNRVTVEIPATGHTAGEAVEENRVEPTCGEAGHYDSVIYCSVCGAELNRVTVEIPATDDHTAGEAVEENRVEPTCTEAGHYDSVIYCAVCGAELNRETVEIPATGHTEADPVEENRVEPTAIADGHYDLVVYCSVCGAELSRTTVTIPATGCTAVLKAARVAFGGYIGLIYEVQLNDDILSDEGAYITFEQNGKTTTALVSSFQIDEASKIAKFRFNTVAKEYADTVTFRMFNSNDRAVKLVSTAGTDYTEGGFQYSVKKYVDYMAANGSTEQMRQVADALSTYCQATQIYFEYNADDLDISEKVDGIGADRLNNYTLSSVGTTPADIAAKELTTVYVEANNLKVKYILGADADEESLSFQIDGVDAETTVEMLKNNDGTESKALVLTVVNILPEDFDQTYTFTVTDGTDTNVITASALSYAQMLFSKKNQTEEAKNLARATYLYYEAAKAYDEMLNH